MGFGSKNQRIIKNGGRCHESSVQRILGNDFEGIGVVDHHAFAFLTKAIDLAVREYWGRRIVASNPFIPELITRMRVEAGQNASIVE